MQFFKKYFLCFKNTWFRRDSVLFWLFLLLALLASVENPFWGGMAVVTLIFGLASFNMFVLTEIMNKEKEENTSPKADEIPEHLRCIWQTYGISGINLETPNFETKAKWDWEYHMPAELVAVWSDLSFNEKLCCVTLCNMISGEYGN